MLVGTAMLAGTAMLVGTAMLAGTAILAGMGGSEASAHGPQRAGGAARFPCFDGLRAVAALSIVAFHFSAASRLYSEHGFGALSRLNLGVSVFFVISGFLLYRPFVVAHLAGRRGPSYRDFMRRRVLRLIPAYWVALTILALAHEAPAVHGWGIPVHFGLVHIYSERYAFGGVPQSWSLSTELAFYVLLPAYAWLLVRRRRRPVTQLQAELLGLGVLYVSSFAFMALTRATDLDSWAPTGVWLPAKLGLFALGMLLALASGWFTDRPGRASDRLGSPRAAVASWVLAGVVFWILATHVPRVPSGFSAVVETEFLSGLIAFFVVLPAVFGGHGPGLVRSLLRSPPLQFAGLVSYGIYLWHVEAITLLFRWTGGRRQVLTYVWPNGGPPYLALSALVLAFTVGLATVSYFLVERRFLRLKDRHRVPAGMQPPAGPGALSSSDGPAAAVASPPSNANRPGPGERAGALERGP